VTSLREKIVKGSGSWPHISQGKRL